MVLSDKKHVSIILYMKVGLLEKGSPTFFMNISDSNSFLNKYKLACTSIFQNNKNSEDVHVPFIIKIHKQMNICSKQYSRYQVLSSERLATTTTGNDNIKFSNYNIITSI